MSISVIVVDDHPLYRDGVVAALSRPGDAIRVVGDTGEAIAALALARELHPSIVLTDLKLPEHDGAWLTQELARHCPETRVLLVTGVEDPQAVSRALDAGAAGILTKDASAGQLRAAIQAVAAGGEFVSAQIARQLTRVEQSSWHRSADELSAREREVLRWLASGASNRQIAERLVLSVRTVDNHVRNIYAKLDLHDRAQAALFAARLGLVSDAG